MCCFPRFELIVYLFVVLKYHNRIDHQDACGGGRGNGG